MNVKDLEKCNCIQFGEFEISHCETINLICSKRIFLFNPFYHIFYLGYNGINYLLN